MKNPYTTTPGKIPPLSYIERPREISDIVEEFSEDFPSNQIFRIMGIRGTGKTVALREIGKELSVEKNWLVVNLNVESNLLEELYYELISQNKLKALIEKINVNIQTPIASIGKSNSTSSFIVQVREILESIKKSKQRLLITIDEVFDSDNLRMFISQCQIWVGEEYPIFLLTAGLETNYNEICSHRSMTYFKRAPKIELVGLDINRIIDDYSAKFNLDEKEAILMAKTTKCYAYAFQLLGSLCWKYEKPFNEILTEFDKEIDSNAYRLIWAELTESEKHVLLAMAEANDNSVESIRKVFNLSPQAFQNTKARLIEKKIVISPSHGKVDFALPRFREFVLRAKLIYD